AGAATGAEKVGPARDRRDGGSGADGGEERRGVVRPLQVVGDLRGVVAREARVAELRGLAPRRPQHALEGEVAERVDGQVLADLLDRVARADELAPGGRVDPVVAGPGDGRRRDAEMHF